MKRLIQIDIGNATETHCGDCEHAQEHCAVFRRRVRIWQPNIGEQNRRLPDCIAAEVKS
jgi:hypothetical protein